VPQADLQGTGAKEPQYHSGNVALQTFQDSLGVGFPAGFVLMGRDRFDLHRARALDVQIAAWPGMEAFALSRLRRL
jgi:hypothetical protein